MLLSPDKVSERGSRPHRGLGLPQITHSWVLDTGQTTGRRESSATCGDWRHRPMAQGKVETGNSFLLPAWFVPDALLGVTLALLHHTSNPGQPELQGPHHSLTAQGFPLALPSHPISQPSPSLPSTRPSAQPPISSSTHPSIFSSKHPPFYLMSRPSIHCPLIKLCPRSVCQSDPPSILISLTSELHVTLGHRSCGEPEFPPSSSQWSSILYGASPLGIYSPSMVICA